jgi:hypothetical protein
MKLSSRSVLIPVAVTVLIGFPALATDAGSGMYSWYNSFWGDQQDRDAISSCDVTTLNAHINAGGSATYTPSGGIGIVNTSNLLFCQLENTLGITGTTPSTGVTGSFTYGSEMFFHAVVSGAAGGAARSDGTNPDVYDFEAQIWGCRGNSAACATTANFAKLMRVFWTKNDDGTVNKGKFYMDQSVMNGLSAAYLTSTTWDMGTVATSRYTETKTMCTSAYCNPATNWYGYNHVAGDKVHTEFFQTHPGDVSTSDMEARFAAAFDLQGNIAGTAVTFVSITGPRNAAEALKNDAITYSHCLSRVKTTDGEDWDYTDTSDCSSLPTANFPNLSIDDVDAWTTTSLNGGVGFGGMTLHPGNL